MIHPITNENTTSQSLLREGFCPEAIRISQLDVLGVGRIGWWDPQKEKTYRNGEKYLVIREDGKRRRVPLKDHIMEEQIGRSLEPHELSYHVDGQRTNYRVENIALWPFAELPSKQPSKGKIKSSGKGSRAERALAKTLEAWWGYGTFRRTPGSGSWDRGEFRMKGDVIAEDDVFPFSIECKNDESWRWSTFLNGKMGGIASFWKQTLEQAEVTSDVPLLVFTRNYHPNYVAMLPETRDLLTSRRSMFSVTGHGEYTLCFTLLDELLKHDRDTIIDLFGG